MTKIEPDDELEDKPLDPAMERVRRKMVRLQIVSGIIMFVSLMAVFGAVVYKTMHAPAPSRPGLAASSTVPAEAPIAVSAALPLGFNIETVSLSNGQILFVGTTPAGVKKAFVFDIAAGRMVADVTVTGGG